MVQTHKLEPLSRANDQLQGNDARGGRHEVVRGHTLVQPLPQRVVPAFRGDGGFPLGARVQLLRRQGLQESGAPLGGFTVADAGEVLPR